MSLSRLGVRAVLRTSFQLPSRLPLPLSWLRRGLDLGARVLPVRTDVLIEPGQIGGVSFERITPPAPSHRIVLHAHGGAFFAGSARSHRGLAAELAVRSRSVVITVDYRRAPEHPYPAALDDLTTVYDALRAQGVPAEHILLSGDSGGAALVVALACQLRQRQHAQPAGLLLISPFLDLTLTLPSVRLRAHQDPMLTKQILRRGAAAYCGALPTQDPRVSPIHANLQGLPPVFIQVGGDEILLDDARVFAERAEAAGVPTTCRIYPGLWHNFQMFHDLNETADQALNELAEWIQAR